MIRFHRLGRGAAMSAAVLSACLAMPAAAAGTKSTAYYASDSNDTAYLIDWYATGNKVRVAGQGGASTGTYVDDGTQKLITLATPLSETWLYTYDDCGTVYAKSAVRQLVVRDLPGGLAQTVPIGEYTQIGGCHEGEVTPFGSVTDEGAGMNRLAMNARPAMDDLQFGLEIAGFSEDHLAFAETTYAQDVVTFLDNRVRFRATGDTVPAAVNAKKWLVMTLPQGDQRAFTRLAVNNTTQGETWLMAGWAKDQATWTTKIQVVKTLEGASFGTVAQASRKWESGLFRGTRTPFFIYLYGDTTGERVQKDLDAGTERRTPISEWGFQGLTLWQERPLGGDDVAVRRWQPLRNEGTKTHWVLESESWVRSGVDTVSIKPRVNYYVDTGKAVPAAR
ncbi:hypothetical protein AACH06_00960 [Ideonella sp. DXS29W]|uniref:YD repeat-containing protein n=1 Tax=Ideonella lacteola TaxID=2984193 RepID=A0ABU9BI12_9BURK